MLIERRCEKFILLIIYRICLKSLPPFFRNLDVVQFQREITAGVYLLKYWPPTMKLIYLIRHFFP